MAAAWRIVRPRMAMSSRMDFPGTAWVTRARFGWRHRREPPEVCMSDPRWFTPARPGEVVLCLRLGHAAILVLSGECLLLIEGEERRLRAWDFVHCPPGTDHGFVGAGEGPCLIFMTGARTGGGGKGLVYPRSELALRHGAGVERETTSSSEAYARFPPGSPGARSTWTGCCPG